MYHSNGHYDTYRAVSIRSQGSVGIFLTIRNARNRRLNQVLARLNIFRNTKSQKCPIPQTYSGLVYIRDAGEIWKRRFHSENESTVLRSHCAGENWQRNHHRSFWICGRGKLGQGNHVIIVTSSLFSKPAFSNFSSLKSVFENLHFRDGWAWAEALLNCRRKEGRKVKVKNDHRSKFSNLSNWKEEAWKNQGFNGIRTRDLRDTGAMLYQLSNEATRWERGQLRWFLSIALRIPTAHDFCVISACKLARARTQRKKFPTS